MYLLRVWSVYGSCIRNRNDDFGIETSYLGTGTLI